MPTINALLAYSKANDISFGLEDGNLRFRAPSKLLTAEFRADLQERKEQLVRYFKSAYDTSTSSMLDELTEITVSKPQYLAPINMKRVWRDIRTPG